jgi:hypothetical protein
MLTPRSHAALSLGMFSEYKAKYNVETADGKEEKGRDKRKVIDMVREDGRTDSTWRDLVSGKTAGKDGERTYRPSMTPRGPKPKSDPSTGKNRLKNSIGHPISERKSTMIWNMMRRRFRTAQNTPAGSFGTVLLLRGKKV